MLIRFLSLRRESCHCINKFELVLLQFSVHCRPRQSQHCWRMSLVAVLNRQHFAEQEFLDV